MAEDHEWVEADVTLDNKEIPERANALLDRLGFSEEDKRDTEVFAGDNPFSDVVRLMAEEAQAIGGPTFDEVKDLLKWCSYLDEKGEDVQERAAYALSHGAAPGAAQASKGKRAPQSPAGNSLLRLHSQSLLRSGWRIEAKRTYRYVSQRSPNIPS